MLGEESPYLSVGTEVSAKYKGAFCEAKVRKVEKLVKCKISFKLGFGSHTVLDTQIKGDIRVGANVEARHPEKKEYVSGLIIKIQDCSQYTVVFDDGDITTLRRSALCQKSGRHFAESETLDQLPLTHPEHFGNPVVGRRGTRKRLGSNDSSGDEALRKGKPREEREAEVGKVVCVELSDKKKIKDNWFPGLVVSPAAQDTVRIKVKEEYLVRSFKDARYYTVPKKEATEFTKEIGSKVENSSLKNAVEKALTFINKNELPPHWDREQLFCDENTDDSESEAGLESDSSDDEPREEKDHFVAQLYKFMDDRGTPINVCPSVCSRDLDLYKLFKVVHKMNGYNRVSNGNQWKQVSAKLGLGNSPGVVTQVKHAYKKYLHSFEDFNRKLGCTMVNHPRTGRARAQRGRALIRDKDRSTPVKIVPVQGHSSKRDDKVEAAGYLTNSGNAANEAISLSEVTTSLEDLETIKDDEQPSSENMDMDDVTHLSSSTKKKFPSLKASPRSKEESSSQKRRHESRTPLTRQKRERPTREYSGEDINSSGEEGKSTGIIEEQRSSTRAKTKEDTAKQNDKKIKEGFPAKMASKGSDSDASKKTKGPEELMKKTAEGVKYKRSVVEEAAKKNRKIRNSDNALEPGQVARPCIPRNKSIVVGDILRVYYGSPSDPNGIYEAKVVDIDGHDPKEQMFLVHYAGWNSRYDEWVKRNKIAENITGTARRNKTSPSKGTRAGSAKRKVGGSREQPRSSTPSSVTSSSSVSKSPAGGVGTGPRRRRAKPTNITATTATTRSRRASQTEATIDSDSDMESFNGTVSDSEAKSENQSPSISSDRGSGRKTAVKRASSRSKLLKTSRETDEVEIKKARVLREEDSSDSEENPDDNSENLIKDEVIDEGDSAYSRKGRDFDLNEIRSELKGIDKAVKVSNCSESVIDDDFAFESVEEGEITSFNLEEDSEPPINSPSNLNETGLSVKIEEEEVSEIMEEKRDILRNIIMLEAKVESDDVCYKESGNSNYSANVSLNPCETLSKPNEMKEDIYEFKEPEPFEFQEVRRNIRIFEENPEKNLDKSPIQKSQMLSKKNERESGQDDNKARRTVVAKSSGEVNLEGEKVVVSIESSDSEECESPPPQLDAIPPFTTLEHLQKDWKDEQEESMGELSREKDSADPPCLIAVTEAQPTVGPARQAPPNLTEVSSDSESDERLVIDNTLEDESLWIPSKVAIKLDPITDGSLTAPVDGASSFAPKRDQIKRSPLVDVRLKRIEDRMKQSPSNQRDDPSFACGAAKSIGDSNNDCTDMNDWLEVDKAVAAEGSDPIRSLVCDEVIPGSPTARDVNDEMCLPTTSTSLIENTPPTTPPSSPQSNISSPTEDRMDRLYQHLQLSPLDNESSKSHRDSSEGDQENDGTQVISSKMEKRKEKGVEQRERRRKCRRRSVGEVARRALGRAGAAHRRREANASDSESSDHSLTPQSDPLVANTSPRPSKYTFCKEMGPDMDSNQRIAFLQQQLQDIRNTHAAVKSELASIERKRKKHRRKLREAKLMMGSPVTVVTVPTQHSILQREQGSLIA